MQTKRIFILLVVFISAFYPVNAQSGKQISDILIERVDVGQTNQSIVVGIIDEKGTRFTSYGKIDKINAAKNSDENTVFEIGSITKVFTGILLAQAVKRGEVNLNDPISKFLPKTVKTPTRNGKEITLLDLATHTSALPRLPDNLAPKDMRNPYADYTVEQMYDFLSKYTLTRDIGAVYEYSNLGVGLLGHILSLRTKMSYEDLVKKRILKPLGMKDTTITLSSALRSRTAQGFTENGEAASLWDLPTLAGAGALRSTAKDMAKFVAANLNLTKTNLAEAFVIAQKPQRDAGAKMKIGLNWHILPGSTGEIIWHNGGTGGFRSFVGFSPTQKRGVVILTNSTESVDDIGVHFLDAQVPLKKVKPYIAVNETLLDEYVGSYELAPNFVFTITRQADRLFAQLTGQPNFRVYATSEKDFYYKVVNAQLTFNRGADGKIESLTLHQGGDQIARKIK